MVSGHFKVSGRHLRCQEPFPETFMNRFPSTQLTFGNIYTSGGLTAGIDLGLHIVEKYFGRVEALKVADHLEYESKSWMIG